MASFDPFGSEDEFKLKPLDDDKHGLPDGLPAFDFGPGDDQANDSLPFAIAADESDPFSVIDEEPILAAEVVPVEVIEGVEAAVVDARPVPVEPAVPLSDEEVERRRRWRRVMFGAAPSWTISLVLHVILIVSLALITLDPVDKVLSILQGGSESESTKIEDFTMDGPQELEAQPVDEQAVQVSSTSPTMDLSALQEPTLSTLQSTLPNMTSDMLSDKLLDRSVLSSSSSSISTALNSRSTMTKSQMLQKFGGSAESEKSVALALKWIAAHQLKKGAKAGAWSFNHTLATPKEESTGQGDFADSTNAATALALLPFLGAGQTHLEGQYKATVKAGLASLISNMKVTTQSGVPMGSWHEARGNMYSHALATITVCEAYAMTQDPDLLQPAQLALNYIVWFQDQSGGGWRYQPQQAGDTSVVGWCLMALKSGRMGNLSVPNGTFVRANSFLDFVSTDNGAFYGYTGPRPDRNPAQTSIGLLCRMYLGWPKDHPGLKDGVAYMSSVGPKMDDLYYTYYATQVMRHYGGDVWERWNGVTRDAVIKNQLKQGIDAGSWDPKGSHTRQGGRLYQTAMATMILEVYYRHLPLYTDKTSEDEFEI